MAGIIAVRRSEREALAPGAGEPGSRRIPAALPTTQGAGGHLRFPLRFSEVTTGGGEDIGIDLLADIDLINHDFFFLVQHITIGRMVEFDLLGE